MIAMNTQGLWKIHQICSGIIKLMNFLKISPAQFVLKQEHTS